MDPSILQKLRNYCAYQERCHSEVALKCRELGLRGDAIDTAIAALIADNFLNEERFAKAFAGGKFRIKHWGRRKIVIELQQRQVSPYCIKKGLQEIDDADYRETLARLANKKYASLEGEHPLKQKQKTIQYLVQKGYETALVLAILEEIANDAS